MPKGERVQGNTEKVRRPDRMPRFRTDQKGRRPKREEREAREALDLPAARDPDARPCPVHATQRIDGQAASPLHPRAAFVEVCFCYAHPGSLAGPPHTLGHARHSGIVHHRGSSGCLHSTLVALSERAGFPDEAVSAYVGPGVGCVEAHHVR